MTPHGLVEVAEFDTKDGIYDCAWSEVGSSLKVVSGQSKSDHRGHPEMSNGRSP